MSASDAVHAIITALHDTYLRLTGFQMPLRRGFYDERQRLWFDFHRAGFTEADLSLVITWLQRKIKAGERNLGALRLSSLIAVEHFDEELSFAKAEQRNLRPRPTPRERVLNQLRPTVGESVTHTAKPIGDYISALRKAANER